MVLVEAGILRLPGTLCLERRLWAVDSQAGRAGPPPRCRQTAVGGALVREAGRGRASGHRALIFQCAGGGSAFGRVAQSASL